MHQRGHFARQNGLRLRAPLALLISLLQCIDFRHRQEGEVLQEPVDIHIRRTQPELVEGVRRGSRRIQPHRTGLRFAKLGAVSFGNQRHGEAVYRVAVHTPGEINAAGNVAPLVRPTNLQATSIALTEFRKVE